MLLPFVVSPAFAGKPNVLLICIDDLRPELGCYGVDYVKSPQIDALAAESRVFGRHFVQAPTCGASRYALLTGTYGPADNHALFLRSKKVKKDASAVSPSMPAWFRQHGYQTVSVGKVSHHPGGFGGKDWDDEAELEMPLSWDRSMMPSGEWGHPRGAMHGLANGEIRKNSKECALFQAVEGPDTIYPDGLITKTALEQLTTLASDEKPFFLTVGLIRPHLPFGAPAKYLEPYKNAELPAIPHPEKPTWRSTWHGSGEFMQYKNWGRDPRTDAEFALEVRRHYAACVSYADAQVGQLMAKLRELKLDENTVVILWGDHGWHLGEHGVWGKHTLFEESLRAPLLIRAPAVAGQGKTSDAVVETIDLFPTLCELAGIDMPEFVDGASLVPQLENVDAAGRDAISYKPGAVTVRTATHRLIVHKDGYAELYDHRSPAKETLNIAEEYPELVEELRGILQERLPGRVDGK